MKEFLFGLVSLPKTQSGMLSERIAAKLRS
jgi:hypothetical protein